MVTGIFRRDMSILESDIVQSVLMHMRPRHLFRLVQTSKAVYEKIKSSKVYFQRLAIRSVFCYIDFDGRLPSHPSMTNLSKGYDASMNEFAENAGRFLEKEFGCRVTSYEDILIQYNVIACRIQYPETKADNRFSKKHKKYWDQMYPYRSNSGDYVDIIKEGQLFDEKELLRIPNIIEDESGFTIDQKKAIAQSIMHIFDIEVPAVFHNAPDPRNVDFGHFLAVGIFLEYRKRARKHSAILARLEDWIMLMATSETFAEIPFTKRYNLMKEVREAVMSRLTYDFPKETSDASAFMFDWQFNKGEAVISMEHFSRAFIINTL